MLLFRKAERRWSTGAKRPTLIYEYKETDNILKIPQQITITGSDVILNCSEDLVKCFQQKIANQIAPSDYLKKIKDDSLLQVNTDPKSLRKRSLQAQILEDLHSEEREMPAIVFTDLTKGVTSIIALLNELPAYSPSVIGYLHLNESVEKVKPRASIIEYIFGKIFNWVSGSCIIECQTSLANYLNIFVPFMKAKQKNEDYFICGFKLIDMCLGDISNLQSSQDPSEEIPTGVPSCPKGLDCTDFTVAHFLSQSHPRSHPKLEGNCIPLAKGEVIKGTYKGATVDILADLRYKCRTWEELLAYPRDRPTGPYRDVRIRVISSPGSPQYEGSKDLYLCSLMIIRNHRITNYFFSGKIL
jgi:hypothetical protein